jgi:hypothetical protein
MNTIMSSCRSVKKQQVEINFSAKLPWLKFTAASGDAANRHSLGGTQRIANFGMMSDRESRCLHRCKMERL